MFPVTSISGNWYVHVIRASAVGIVGYHRSSLRYSFGICLYVSCAYTQWFKKGTERNVSVTAYSRNQYVHIRGSWCHWDRGISEEFPWTFIWDIITSIMCNHIIIQERTGNKCIRSQQTLEMGMSTSGEQGAVGIAGYHMSSYVYLFGLFL